MNQMKVNKPLSPADKKTYQSPEVEQISLDTEISLVMTSPPPPNPQMPQMPEGWVQKIFRLH